MPLEYPGGGVIREHTAVRETVGLFDVSHLGKATVTGEGARGFVNRCLTNDVDRIEAGRAQYTLCCAESGGVVDDLLVYLQADDRLFLIPNAANTAEVVRRLQAAAPPGITVTNRHEDFAVLAVQGPRSPEVLAELGLPAELGYMSFTEASFGGAELLVCRSGYTGEHGYELLPAAADAAPLWSALLDAVRRAGGLPAGLAARDTLRTEMGYPLHGHDLSLDISPVQARAGWAVGWRKPEFWGREALLAEREAGPVRQLTGLRALDRGIPRPGMAVTDADGRPIGEVTSGTFSPTLRTGIALALLAAGSEEGSEALVDVRGRPSRMVVGKPPFVDSRPV